MKAFATFWRPADLFTYPPVISPASSRRISPRRIRPLLRFTRPRWVYMRGLREPRGRRRSPPRLIRISAAAISLVTVLLLIPALLPLTRPASAQPGPVLQLSGAP